MQVGDRTQTLVYTPILHPDLHTCTFPLITLLTYLLTYTGSGRKSWGVESSDKNIIPKDTALAYLRVSPVNWA